MQGDPITMRIVFEDGAANDRPISAKVCEVCGQTFSTSDQDAVYYHGPAPHAPLQPGAAQPAEGAPPPS